MFLHSEYCVSEVYIPEFVLDKRLIGIEDNSKIIFLLLNKNTCCDLL